jgi:hypothetical protein
MYFKNTKSTPVTLLKPVYKTYNDMYENTQKVYEKYKIAYKTYTLVQHHTAFEPCPHIYIKPL